MLRHIFILIVRNARRFGLSFVINIIGLSTGLASAILIYLWVADELAMDKFHAKGDRIFQIMTNENRPDDIVTRGFGPGQLESALPAEIPEIEYAVGSSGVTDRLTLAAENKHVNAKGQFAGQHFFEMFSFPLLHGNADKVLTGRQSIVISERLAMAFFNSTDSAVGKVMQWEIPGYKEEVIVSGVFKNVPLRSHIQFDFVMPYEIYLDFMREFGSLSWGNHNAITYVLLQENTAAGAFNEKIRDFIKTRESGSILTLFAKPYTENYLYGTYENGNQVGGRITYVKMFSSVAAFIVLIACINFMNLSTARASRRVREVGVRKTIGASRSILVIQHIGESLTMAILSMAIALAIVEVMLPRFNIFAGKELSLTFESGFLLAMLSLTVATGLLAGSYPALYISGFNPARVLKSHFTLPGGEQWARKSLVVFQFTVAIISMVFVWVLYAQMIFVQTKHLGYDRENVLYMNLEGRAASSLETFLSEVKTIPGVVEASGMSGSVMGAASFTTGSFDWPGRDPNVTVQFEHLGIYYDLIELLGVDMAEGRSFSRDFPSDSLGIIFNERAIEVMGLADPVGKTFNLWGTDYKIVGVVKDFHFESLREAVKPFFFRITPDDVNKVMIRIAPGREREVLRQLTAFYHDFNPGYVLEYTFLDKEYDAQYQAEQRVSVLAKYFAALAILISCLGLFGLAAFTAERRMKEIGIRKVLGSSVTGIIYRLSGDFTRSVLVAILIALPVSYFGVSRWLDSFAYRIDLEWWYFAGAGMAALAIAWLTVGLQALKAARLDPVVCLRDE